VIVALNSHPVPNYDALYNLLTEIKVGEPVTLSIQRGKKKMDVKIKTIDIAAL
jgi:S1-C subfamily serine protease